jgi:hypothetical protein
MRNPRSLISSIVKTVETALKSAQMDVSLFGKQSIRNKEKGEPEGSTILY